MNQKTKSNIIFCTNKEKLISKKQNPKKQINLLSKKRYCFCSKSKCCKKYCDCFSKGEECNDNFCSCLDCHNKISSNKKFEIKFGNSCTCQKSGCTKKYCQCFNKGDKCNSCCSCKDCKNKIICNENINFLNDENLKKVYIKNESVIIDNYRLRTKENIFLI